MNTTMPTVSLQVRRHIKASRTRVFDAWTKPELMSQWLNACGGQVLSIQNTLRVGGEYSFRTSKPEMGEMAVKGIYKEITPPERLVFTWSYDSAKISMKEETLVTVELTEKDGGTEVCLTHERFPDAESCDQHQQGWGRILDQMGKLFGGKA
ncbi:MAG TPA: SRPBCC domain-containing protein [Opitutales bacterium]|jgi:uncharacterized protein YndB with AHSA1/START domain|nr:SRPBCC domain-containing protein [Opitutales bacterium]